MAVISEENGFLFILTPRTASTATAISLWLKLGCEWIPRQPILDAEGKQLVDRKHSTINKLLKHNLLQKNNLEKLFKFTTVRNPFDSLLSLYVKKKTVYQPLMKDKNSFINQIPGFNQDMEWIVNHSFSEWILRDYLPKMKKGMKQSMYAEHVKYVDFIMKFENLQNDFKEAMRRLGADQQIKLPRFNVTESREPDYRSHYTAEAREVLEYVLEEDLQRFDYSF